MASLGGSHVGCCSSSELLERKIRTFAVLPICFFGAALSEAIDTLVRTFAGFLNATRVCGSSDGGCPKLSFMFQLSLQKVKFAVFVAEFFNGYPNKLVILSLLPFTILNNPQETETATMALVGKEGISHPFLSWY